jgi:hypothetical protein
MHSGLSPSRDQLEARAHDGTIAITSSHVLLEELASDNTLAADLRRAKAARLPRGSSGFMVGHSTVGGPDVSGGPNVAKRRQACCRGPKRDFQGMVDYGKSR